MAEEKEKQRVIELIDGYVLVVDRLSWSLGKEIGKTKDGKSKFKYYGHFGSPEKALRQLGRELVYDSLRNAPTTVSTLLQCITESNTRLENFLRENFPEYEVVKKGE